MRTFEKICTAAVFACVMALAFFVNKALRFFNWFSPIADAWKAKWQIFWLDIKKDK